MSLEDAALDFLQDVVKIDIYILVFILILRIIKPEYMMLGKPYFFYFFYFRKSILCSEITKEKF